jgi:uncharacterized membrane protein YdjX (TVP38/TMEM64 family)
MSDALDSSAHALLMPPGQGPASGGGFRWVRRAAIGAALLAIGYVVWSVWDHEALTRWIQSARPMPFFLSLAVLPALGLPLTPFFVLAGAAYTPAGALLGSALGLAANLALCYAIARLMRGPMERLLGRFGYALPTVGAGRWSTIRFALAVKLTPGVPQVAKNYLLGVAGVPFALYFTLSMLITGAYATLLILLGRSLFEHELRRALPWLVLLALLLLCLWWWRRKTAPALPSAQAA